MAQWDSLDQLISDLETGKVSIISIPIVKIFVVFRVRLIAVESFA